MHKIFIQINEGFGNKIFNLLIILYFQYINGGEMNIIINKSKHESVHDKSIFDIFKLLKNKFTILENMSYIDKIEKNIEEKKRFIFDCKNIKSLSDFKINNSYEFIYITKKTICYKFMYDIYNKLPYNNLFKINEDIITDKVKEITNCEYMLIHIRYGDKLELAFKGDNKWIIYTPQFYKSLIKKYKGKIKIYIITDDIKLVKKYILDNENSEEVKILDLPWWEAFYCLTKSTYTILSISTFSILGTMLNKNIKKAFIITRPNDKNLINNNKLPEEEIIGYTNWKKIDNKKYILNYDKKFMRNMIEYNKKKN
jgi:hypothetical protein